jgi:hypothetical protein
MRKRQNNKKEKLQKKAKKEKKLFFVTHFLNFLCKKLKGNLANKSN